MWEENQNVSMMVWTRMPLSEQARRFTEFAKAKKEEKNQEMTDKINTDMQNIFIFWLDSSDHWTSTECNRDVRITQVAQWINEHFYWWTRAKDVEENPRWLVNDFLWNNKGNDYFNKVINYIWDDSNELCDASGFYSSMWWETNIPDQEWIVMDSSIETPTEDQDDATWYENTIWWIVETALWIPKLAVRWWAYLGYGRDKLMWEDETIAKANLNKTLNGIDETFEKITPWDEDSLVRGGVNLVTDLWATALMTMIPWVWEAKRAEFLTKYPKLASLLNGFWTFEKFAKKFPKWAKTIKTFLKGWKLWAEIEVINNALDWEFTTIEEWLEWWLFGALTERWLNTNAAKKISTWMQTNWLMTTARMRNIVNKIKDFTTNATPERLANFMTKYGLTGTRDAIKRRAEELYKWTMEIIDWIFSKVEWEFESKVTTETIDSLINIIEEQIASKKVPASWLQKTLDRLKEIYSKSDMYRADVMEEVKRLADKIIRWFKESWDLKIWYEWWVETRKILQKQLEEIWKPYWDIEMLNNIVQTSYWIMDSIWQKMAWDNFMNIATKAIPVALWIPAIKDIMKWDRSSIPADMVLPLVSSNTWLRTHAWSLLNRMRGTTRDQVNSWLTSEWKEMLSKEATEEFMNILRGDEWFQTWFKNFLANYLKDSLIIWETNVWEWVKDMWESMLWDVYSEEI